MKDDMPIQTTASCLEDVFSAWIVGAACILCLLLVSLVWDPSPLKTEFTERNLAGGPAVERIGETVAGGSGQSQLLDK